MSANDDLRRKFLDEIVRGRLCENSWQGRVDPNFFVTVPCTVDSNDVYVVTPLHVAILSTRCWPNFFSLISLGARSDVLAHKRTYRRSKQNYYIDFKDLRRWDAAMGRSVLHIVAEMSCFFIAEFTRFYVFGELIRAATNVDVLDSMGNTPLHVAVREIQEADEFRQLMRGGANPNLRNCNGVRPLFDAFQKRCFFIARYLASLVSNDSVWECVPLAKNWISLPESPPFERRDCITILFNELCKRERQRLLETAIGLRALDLSVLCVLEIYQAAGDEQFSPTQIVQWEMAKKVKNFNV